jgi:hypothetical protein
MSKRGFRGGIWLASTTAVFSLLTTSIAFSQTAYSSLVQAQQNNWVVRATSSGTILAEGRITGVGADSVGIGSSVIHIAAITDLDRRTRIGGGGPGAAFAAATGLGFIGYILAGDLCRPRCSLRHKAVGAGVGIAFGASVGGLLGGTLQPAKIGWTRIWP